MWSARHRWLVALLWFVATIGVFAVSLAMGGIDAADANQNPNERKLEASEAYDVFNAGGTNDPYQQVIVVVTGGPGATTNPAFQAAVGDLVGKLHAASAPLNGVTTTTFDPFPSPLEAPPEAGLVSADGTTVRIVGPDLRGRRAGHPAHRAGPADRRCRPGRPPGPDDPRDQQPVPQRGHQRPHLDRARRLAPAHDPADVLHPAVRVRGDRRRGGPARPGDQRAARGLRDPGHLQPDLRGGQPERDPADRAHRAGGRRRLLAVHDHPLPGRAARRAATG